MGAGDGWLKLKMPMCSLLSLLYDVFPDCPSDLPFFWIHMTRGVDGKLDTAVWLLWPCGIANPNKRFQAPAKPVFGLCLVPTGNHLKLA